MDKREQLLEEISAALVLMEISDVPALAKLHDLFAALSKSLGKKTPPVRKIVDRCSELVEQIILGDTPDKEKTFEILCDSISALQKVIRDKHELAEVSFPEELGVEGTAKTARKSKKSKKKSKPEVSPPVAREPAAATEAETPVDNSATETDQAQLDADAERMLITFKDADTSLLAEFISEAREHCLTAEQMLMDLETGEDHDGSVNAIFRSFHTIKGAAGFLELGPISILAHESETLLDMAREGTIKIAGPIADVIFKSIDSLRQVLDEIEQGLKTGSDIDGTHIITDITATVRRLIKDPNSGADDETGSRLGDILVDMGSVTQNDIDKALKAKAKPTDRIGETLVKQGKVPAKAIAHALRSQRQAKANAGRTGGTEVKEQVKIDTERLDRLVNTIGELVIAESMVGHDDEFLAIAPPHVVKNVNHLNKITRELQEMGTAMRLVPVRPTFQKLARAVRDLTRRSGKKVQLILSGEEVEVDRTIVECIGDPLMHMIRNSVDHAIETPSERVEAGKSETGTVQLKAFHKGGSIHFQIQDDGRGLNTERILEKAREKGFIDNSRELSKKEIHALIMLPGFSTAKKVTDISGRGVGMDVVKKGIDAMRGHLDIDSELNVGTTFTMKLPLTLAIIDGMLVRVGSEKYIVPTISVLESVNLATSNLFTIGGTRKMLKLRDRLLPVVYVADLFNLPRQQDDSSEQIIVIVEDGINQIGLVISELLGQRQTVIKSLGPVFKKQKWVSGGAILSDGSVGLIMDIGGIVQIASKVEPSGRSDSSRLATSTEDVTAMAVDKLAPAEAELCRN